MSKSNPNPASRIELADRPEEIRKKIMRAVTDSGAEVRYDEVEKPAISNLLTIYSLFTGTPVPEIEQRFEGMGYGAFKRDLADVTIEGLAPIQQRLTELNERPGQVISTLDQGADRAREIAAKTMKHVREAIGIGLPAV